MLKLTEVEYRLLQIDDNLADAHARQTFLREAVESGVLDVEQLFLNSLTASQLELDQRCYAEFHTLAGQRSVISTGEHLPCYSSSMAMEVIANVLRIGGYRVTLIEPTFDNLPDTLRRHLQRVYPLRVEPGESLAAAVAAWMGSVVRSSTTPDALCLVLPNNPTGDLILKEEWDSLVEACAEEHVLLIVDASFRLFDTRACYDTYAPLLQAACPFLVIEDSGKIWPTADLKMAFLNCSPDLFQIVSFVHNDFLLNIPPFIELILLACCATGVESVRTRIAQNRAYFRDRLARLRQGPVILSVGSRVSVEFLRLPSGFDSLNLVRRLADEQRVAILSGAQFYWSDPASPPGRSSIRVAMARDPDAFAAGCDRLLHGLERLLSS